MGEFRSQIFSAVIFLVFGGILALLLRTLHVQWWKRSPRLRRATWLVPAVGVVLAGLWALAQALDLRWLMAGAGFLVSFFFVSFLMLTAALPLSGLLLSAERLVGWIRRKDIGDDQSVAEGVEVEPERSKEEDAPEVDLGRRSLITTGALAFPMIAVGASGTGVIASTQGFTYTPQRMQYPGLHPDLEGLRILHISDLHLGYYVRLDDLERLLIGAESAKPDLVVVTGDLTDDLTVTDEALGMIAQLKPTHGTVAALGNHEYYTGVREIIHAYDRSAIPLLVNRGVSVPVGGSEIYVGGVDDPASAGRGREFGQKEAFLQQAVEESLDGAPSDAFHLMLTHRPEGFDAAAANNLELTLAGHTHAGGQMGWNGRSFVETFFGMGKYMWGLYEKNDGASKLYTSAGAGHWLPFRLGVPREVPVYTLSQFKIQK